MVTLLASTASPRTVSVPVQTELPGLAPGQAGLPTAASVGRAMLTAFHGVRDDIEYTTETGGVSKGATTSLYRTVVLAGQARRRDSSRLNACCSPRARRRYRT